LRGGVKEAARATGAATDPARTSCCLRGGCVARAPRATSRTTCAESAGRGQWRHARGRSSGQHATRFPHDSFARIKFCASAMVRSECRTPEATVLSTVDSLRGGRKGGMGGAARGKSVGAQRPSERRRGSLGQQQQQRQRTPHALSLGGRRVVRLVDVLGQRRARKRNTRLHAVRRGREPRGRRRGGAEHFRANQSGSQRPRRGGHGRNRCRRRHLVYEKELAVLEDCVFVCNGECSPLRQLE